jgi:hypothetical protein
VTRTIRRQLSVFAPEPMRTALDALRATLDPVQHRLIPAHVTLCREDELEVLTPDANADAVAAAVALRLTEPPASRALTLVFGTAESFDEHGILLPCVDGESAFHALRAEILTPAIAPDALRRPAAHLTLAHPRNPRAPGNSLAVAQRTVSPLRLTFGEVHLIERVGSAPWTVQATFALTRAEPPDV